MTITTLVKYLLGSKQAILDIADSNRALWLGLLFVLSAGFAREYDGEDLLHEPWHLLIPLGASLVSSFVLYGLVWCVADVRRAKNPFWRGYATFLILFWMTAPLAWVYAIPVERFLSAADSVRANVWLLGLVSAWRVALITRVVSVVYRCRAFAAFFVVMLFADAAALAALNFIPRPIIGIMGGIRHTEAESVLLETTFFVGMFGTLTIPLWLFAAVVVASRRSLTDSWQTKPYIPVSLQVDRWLWILGAAAIAIWAFVLPATQDEQINRNHVESLFRAGDLAGAVAYMSERQIDDFPSHWDPPPRIGFGEAEPDVFDLLEVVGRNESASWVRSIVIQKILLQSSASSYGIDRLLDLAEMNEEDLATYVGILKEIHNGPEIAASHQEEIEGIFWKADQSQDRFPISDSRRELLLQIRDFKPDDDKIVEE
ncbi:MAG: hypothetical protein H8E66_02915 [Planctomycetes bacterium]|nr:hypothetical protein [Planctomycetota bacterium]